jgi:hypothetical protein
MNSLANTKNEELNKPQPNSKENTLYFIIFEESSNLN